MFGPHEATPAQLRRRLGAERGGTPFLLVRGPDGEEQVHPLAGTRVTVGRDPEADVPLADPSVSRLHAQLERLGSSWVLTDDGLSQNGSFVGPERVAGRRRVVDGDVLRFGATHVLFREPAASRLNVTVALVDEPVVEVSPAQRRVLVALCRPFRDGGAYAKPATNREVAEELVLSVEAVKDHVRALFGRFGVEDLPREHKRLRLVEKALESGVVSRREL